MQCNSLEHRIWDRRTFLIASAAGLGGLGQLHPLCAAQRQQPPDKSTILIWLDGGASHIDTWDMKPQAPLEIRGEFTPIETTVPGINLCEHLPLLAQQTHHLSIVRSVTHADGKLMQGPNNHASGYYHGLTAHPPDPSFSLGEGRRARPDDHPFMGSVVAYKRKLHPSLPQLVMLPRKIRVVDDTPGQYATSLGTDFDPLVIEGNLGQPPVFTLPALELQSGVSTQRLHDRRSLLKALDRSHRQWEGSSAGDRLTRHQQRAFSLLYSQRTKTAFDISREPESVRMQYGQGVNAMSLLMARRLVEVGVPFVTVIWKKEDPVLHKKKACIGTGSWDTHGNNFNCLKEILLPNFDRMFSALLDDLFQRGMLDNTLVMVNSEMGRKPRIGDRRPGGTNGRDHWRQCMSVLFAGGGTKGGQIYGSSDRFAEYPIDQPVTPADIAQTVYQTMGIGNLEAIDGSGNPFNLLEQGQPLQGLF